MKILCIIRKKKTDKILGKKAILAQIKYYIEKVLNVTFVIYIYIYIYIVGNV